MKVIDLTHTIKENMPVFPGTEPPKLAPASTFETDGFRETLLTMFSHTGTHMDAPAHVREDGITLDKFPADKFVGKAIVIDCSDLSEGDIIDISYIDKYKGSIRCPSNWGTTGTIYWKARDFKNTTDNTVVISDVADQTYTGSLIAPNVTVTCNDVELVKDTDYTVSYSNNKNVGTATISITGIGDYTGTIKKNFNIVARGISDTTIGSIPNQTYTGNSISALPVITYNGATLTKDVDYTLS